MNTLYFVIPCYNEESVLPESAAQIRNKLNFLISEGKISEFSRILLVNDGSQDRTWELISQLHKNDPCFDGLCLSKNRGHQNAVMAGLVTAAEYADMTITMDADMQDDINAVDEMVDKYLNGAQVVCGVRNNRDSDSFLKRFTAQGYYALMNLFGARLVYNHADFRLLSKEAVNRLCCYGTEDLFIRGLITRLGFPIEKVFYARLPRLAGESKYTIMKMLQLAVKGFSCGRMKAAAEPQIGELYIGAKLHA